MSKTPSSFNGNSSSSSATMKQSNILMCNDNLLSRQLSNLSMEGYHRGEAVSVPFTWESQPGTPKVKFKEASLPPLSPPPSYYSSPNNRQTTKQKKTSPKPNLLKSIFPKRNNNKNGIPPSVSCSSSSSSSSSYSSRKTSYSVPSSPMVYSGKNKQDEDLYDIPASSLCFGNSGSRGYSSMVKKLLLGEFL